VERRGKAGKRAEKDGKTYDSSWKLLAKGKERD